MEAGRGRQRLHGRATTGTSQACSAARLANDDNVKPYRKLDTPVTDGDVLEYASRVHTVEGIDARS